jgi:hypothetical protein
VSDDTLYALIGILISGTVVVMSAVRLRALLRERRRGQPRAGEPS